MPPKGGSQWIWSLEEWTTLNLIATETDLVRAGATPDGHKVDVGWDEMARIHNSMWRSAPGALQLSGGMELANAYHGRWRPEKTRKWRQNVLRSSGNWSPAEMAARADLRLEIDAWAQDLGVNWGVNTFGGIDGVGGNIHPTNPRTNDAKVVAQWNGGQGEVVAGDPPLGTHVPPSPQGWTGAWPPLVFGPMLPPGGLPAPAPPLGLADPTVVPANPSPGPLPGPPIPTMVSPPFGPAHPPSNSPMSGNNTATAQHAALAEGEVSDDYDSAGDADVSAGDEPGEAATGDGGEAQPTDRGEREKDEPAEQGETEEQRKRMEWKQRMAESVADTARMTWEANKTRDRLF